MSTSWTTLSNTESYQAFQRCKTLLRLMLITTRRFYSLLKFEIYRRPTLIPVRSRDRRLKTLLPPLSANSVFRNYIEIVSGSCQLAADVFQIFSLPRIKTIILHSTQDMQTAGCWDSPKSRMSSVDSLQLIDCGVNDYVLQTLMCLPGNLRALRYDIKFPWDDSILNIHLSNEILSMHKNSLENLVFTISRWSSLSSIPAFLLPCNFRN
jgi:hypothetical protein